MKYQISVELALEMNIKTLLKIFFVSFYYYISCTYIIIIFFSLFAILKELEYNNDKNIEWIQNKKSFYQVIVIFFSHYHTIFTTLKNNFIYCIVIKAIKIKYCIFH
jgi:hypothetical protein